MTLTPGLRKFALTVHITVSVGWLGAVVAYLALAVNAMASQDAQTARAAYVATGLIGQYVIVPLAFTTLLTGLVMSLGTPWGLFRHYWVLITFLLTIFAIIVLLTRLEHFSYAAGFATAQTRHGVGRAGDGRLGGDLLHAGGGLLVLLVITGLNVYKPRGLTPYGWRKQHEQPTGLPAEEITV